jgi:intracellular multiplication protein IcmJ
MKLELAGELNNWEKFKARKKNKNFLAIKAKFLKRDKNTCRFCGYHGHVLEVINYDNNYRNNTPSNLMTACVFCARCRLLDSYKLDYKGGDRIIYLPELSQTQLNQLCRLLFFESTKEANSEAAYNAKTILAKLMDRAVWLDEKAKAQLSHPGLFLYYLHDSNKSVELLNRLRWLPDPVEYQSAIKVWQSEFIDRLS